MMVENHQFQQLCDHQRAKHWANVAKKEKILFHPTRCMFSVNFINSMRYFPWETLGDIAPKKWDRKTDRLTDRHGGFIELHATAKYLQAQYLQALRAFKSQIYIDSYFPIHVWHIPCVISKATFEITLKCVYELSLFNSGSLKLVELNFHRCAPQKGSPLRLRQKWYKLDDRSNGSWLEASEETSNKRILFITQQKFR